MMLEVWCGLLEREDGGDICCLGKMGVANVPQDVRVQGVTIYCPGFGACRDCGAVVFRFRRGDLQPLTKHFDQHYTIRNWLYKTVMSRSDNSGKCH